MIKKIFAFGAVVSATLPVLAMAAGNGELDLTGANTAVTTVTAFLSGTVIPFFFAIAGVVFLWGVVKFIISAGDEEARATGKSFMIWGIVGIVVMLSFWGIVNFITKSTGLGGETVDVTLPSLPVRATQ